MFIDDVLHSNTEKPTITPSEVKLRVEQEHEELRAKITNLHKFISVDNAKFTELPHQQRELLLEQYKVMMTYGDILLKRLLLM